MQQDASETGRDRLTKLWSDQLCCTVQRPGQQPGLEFGQFEGKASWP